MKCLVTGAAGFIGSHLTEGLLSSGCEVSAIDSFEDYYPRSFKDANVKGFVRRENCRFLEANLLDTDLDALLEGIEVVFHMAATPGVRASWGVGFDAYARNNIRAMERLLFACKDRPLKRFVYASSSSIYGDASDLPLRETSVPQPISPYGVTKLAGEHLCRAYHRNFGVPVVSLRFFTVYGPRQRADMAFHKFCRAALLDEPLPLYGDGEQSRDFTFVTDTIKGIVSAGSVEGIEGEVLNIGGGGRVTVNRVIEILGDIVGRPVKVDHRPVEKGDVRDTQADTEKIQKLLGFAPSTPVETGLAAEVEWMKAMLGL